MRNGREIVRETESACVCTGVRERVYKMGT